MTSTNRLLNIAGLLLLAPCYAFAASDCQTVEYADRVEVVCTGDGKAASSVPMNDEGEGTSSGRRRFGEGIQYGIAMGTPEDIADTERRGKATRAAKEAERKHQMELLKLQQEHELKMEQIRNQR